MHTRRARFVSFINLRLKKNFFSQVPSRTRFSFEKNISKRALIWIAKLNTERKRTGLIFKSANSSEIFRVHRSQQLSTKYALSLWTLSSLLANFWNIVSNNRVINWKVSTIGSPDLLIFIEKIVWGLYTVIDCVGVGRELVSFILGHAFIRDVLAVVSIVNLIIQRAHVRVCTFGMQNVLKIAECVAFGGVVW